MEMPIFVGTMQSNLLRSQWPAALQFYKWNMAVTAGSVVDSLAMPITEPQMAG